MVKLGDWVQRTREPLPGMPPFDWQEFAFGQVVHIEDDETVEVEFPCRCMSISQVSDSLDRFKMWHPGEYLLLDKQSRKIKEKQFQEHCKISHD